MKTVAQLMEDAMALSVKGDSVGCAIGLQDVLLREPNHLEAWNNRASMLLKMGHPFDAITNYDKAIAICPTAEIYSNRGVAYVELGLLDNAMENYDKAIKLNPDLSEAYMNKAIVHWKRRNTEKAIEFYREATVRNPNNIDAHFGLGVSLLENGEFIEGWKEFEWRWKSSQMAERGIKVPRWEGEKAHSPMDVLVLYSEQGHGDALQFIRYVPLIKKAWGGKVVVEVKQQLVRIARTVGADGVIAYGEPLPENLKVCVPMMSVPRILKTTLETIPSSIPYFKADPYRVKLWKQYLAKLPDGMKIGLCWAGGARPLQPIADGVDKRRSTTLAEFGPLAIPGLSFVSLQVGEQSAQVKTPPSGMTIGDFSEEIGDFYDTAALIECLALVISVDTAVLHLAAALGKPTWLLSRYDNCWRWLKDRKDSPWYPTLRQFRQPSDGDWNGMMNEVRGELTKLVQQRKAA